MGWAMVEFKGVKRLSETESAVKTESLSDWPVVILGQLMKSERERDV
jgi:hypothetical protein